MSASGPSKVMHMLTAITELRYCIGVLLAGGQSRRMGCDKALLDWSGRPLIEHQLATLRAAGVDVLQVSGTRPDYDGIPDRQPQRGPLMGLISVMATFPEDDCDLLVMPVDMPHLTAALLRRLRCEQPTAPSLRFVDQVLPWRFHLDTASRTVLAELAWRDESRSRSLRAAQQAMLTEELPLSLVEATQLVDCNTPERWSEVIS